MRGGWKMSFRYLEEGELSGRMIFFLVTEINGALGPSSAGSKYVTDDC
jgi:hypothetical protein